MTALDYITFTGGHVVRDAYRLVICTIGILAFSTPAFTQAAAPAQQPPITIDSSPCATAVTTADAAIKAATACVGWLQNPISGTRQAAGFVVSSSASVAIQTSGVGIGAVANEFFSLVAEIAVDRARRQGLAFVKLRLESGICDLEFAPVSTKGQRQQPQAERDQILRSTCVLVRSTDLPALVGQGRALRSALTSDLVGVAERYALAKVDKVAPLGNSARAAFNLIRRFAADPDTTLTKNDAWLIVDAFLNTPWGTPDGIKAESLKTLQFGVKAARIYLEALRLAPEPERPKVDLARIVRETLSGQTLNAEQTARVIDIANLAARAGIAAGADGVDDLRESVRASLRLVFGALTTIRTTIPDAPLVPPWAATVAEAALNADAPRLIASLAEIAREQVDIISGCKREENCTQLRKFTTLLTGVATYAVTYDSMRLRPDTTPEERLALMQDQRAARKEAIESVIDAATDRSGRDGTAIWSLGTSVGGTFRSRQRLDASAALPGGEVGREFAKLGAQLHVPLGISYQVMPRGNGWKPLPLHVMVSFLDLSNYVGKTTEAGSSPDWRSIIAPGVQVGVALPWISRPSNLVVLGGSVSYAPQFVASTTGTTTTYRGAQRRGLFVTYYVPLWDFN